MSKYDELIKHNQWILHCKKKPVDYRTLQIFKKDSGWLKNPELWTSFNNASMLASLSGPEYGIGFIFTPNDNLFFIDIDNAAQPDGQWSPLTYSILNMFPGALVETSISGTGLHIIGSTTNIQNHRCKCGPHSLELYHKDRYVAIGNMETAIGDASVDHSGALPSLINTYFPPKTIIQDASWTTEPTIEYTPFPTDDELIATALKSKSIAAKLGRGISFADLWNNNIEVLSDTYSPLNNKDPYDRSSADSALTQHLAFWCGKNADHILRLIWKSKLIRDKWNHHKSYLTRTITKAISLQRDVYTGGKSIVKQHKGKKLQGTEKQIKYANDIRDEKLKQCSDNIEFIKLLCGKHGPIIQAGFWIDNKNLLPQELIKKISPLKSASIPSTDEPIISEGYQFLGVTQQLEYFKGCVYVQDIHRVFIPNGALLKSDQFNTTYGGYLFQLSSDVSSKPIKKAWDAFTESQIIRYPKADTTCFRPRLQTGSLIKKENRILVNTYVPIDTPRIQGDVTPFLTHLAKNLPDEQDRVILLTYMAACIQYKGCKFQWTPLIQGIQGNGKTLYTRCIAFAIGERYTHMPFASEMTEKYNDWLFDRLFIGVEDVYVAEHKQETIEILKPMITSNRLAKRAMQQGQVMADVYANFLLNCNPKTGIKIIRGDRRFAPFYTAQQTLDDLKRDGMDGNYFPNLYNWLRDKNGYAIVNDYLSRYTIPIELNPALEVGGLAQRAPDTTSTVEAYELSLGGVEQEIIEAIQEGRCGFCGGWISSMALERLLQHLHAARRIPRNKRKEILQSLDYSYHPALTDGRVTRRIPLDGGKPRLFIKNGHIHCNLVTIDEITRAYQDAQRDSISLFNVDKTYHK